MLQAILRNVWFPLQDMLYPPVCLTCDNDRPDRRLKICPECRSALTPLTADHPAWRDLRSRLLEEGAVDDILSCYLFEREGKLQQIVHLLKYRGHKSIGTEFGTMIGERMLGDRRFALADCLVPVPLHRLRLRERGYNQSALLCAGIASVTRLPVRASLLHRTAYTQTQTHLTTEERRRNVGSAFAAGPGGRTGIQGAAVVLVDDVITTGSTVAACASVLRRHGARSVVAVSLAIAR